ncbi:MAG: DEAD/DEAH box helicase family protein [bacterium]|nr:DEAD/DEAH box helicase family protein [bacterium]
MFASRPRHSAVESMMDPLSNPVINTPYEEPQWHWELDMQGRALEGRAPKDGRRPALGILPVPQAALKGEQAQGVLEFTPDDLNPTVQDIRIQVRRWRGRHWPESTPTTKKLLRYWTRENRHIRPFFAQLEAIETIIWLTETKEGRRFARDRIAPVSENMNEGLIRWATKMATGTGKTMVMGMLIVWHTLNHVHSPTKGPYTRAFLAITPGHTVRERLGELMPSHPDNIYDQMDLVPPDLRSSLNSAAVAIHNFQAFQRRDLFSGVTGDGRKVLDPHGTAGVEDAAVMLDRVLRHLKGRNRIVVLNDEAHHCYNPSQAKGTSNDQKVAGIWFNAILELARQKRLLSVHDFSATPMFISTAAKAKGAEMFPWVVSDYPLLEAIESGLVKIPRLPMEDDAKSFDLKWRALYANANPKKVTRTELPGLLDDALKSLYIDWAKEWARWRRAGRRTPPVFIVVANSISNAQALYDYIGGYELVDKESGRIEYVAGKLAEFSNVELEGRGWKQTPVTLLMHSKLDSEDKIAGALAKLVKAQAARLGGATGRSNRGATDDVTLLRNVLNTVGREGEPGEHIRCVISVSMLTEGWDTRTVTHVLGYRAFSTQLLCEQVTGRALRRADYESFDSEGRLTPEYSQVLGIPFDFMPTGEPVKINPPNPVYTVKTMPDRSHLRIPLPRLTGYSWEPASARLRLDPDRVQPYKVVTADHPTLVELGGVSGDLELVGLAEVRPAQAAWQIAAACLRRVIEPSNGHRPAHNGLSQAKGRLFSDLQTAVQDWLAHPAVSCPDHRVLLQSHQKEEVVGRVLAACLDEEDSPRLVGRFDADAPVLLDTSAVWYETTLPDRYPAYEEGGPSDSDQRSEVNIAACHSGLEAGVAKHLDRDIPAVEAWVRNFRLGWEIPYLYDGVWHSYEPDFVARVRDQEGRPWHLIVECKGQPDEKSDTKARYVEDWWIPAVAGSSQIPEDSSRWGFVEVNSVSTAAREIQMAINDLIRSKARR